MDLPLKDIYKKVKPSVVAIVSRLSRQADFPDIIGTGFIADSNGIIITNDHVIKAIGRLPRRKSKPEEWPIQVMLFHNIPDEGMVLVPLEVEMIATLGRKAPVKGYYYGPEIPDIGFIFVKVKNLPAIEIEDNFELEEGDNVFISGFPMGTDTLKAPGWLHQITPVLQKGIISAIQPFPCSAPHGLLIETMTQGGSSGSPIFNTKNGKVCGLLWGGLIEAKGIPLEDKKYIPYENNTCLTTAVPGFLVKEIFDRALKEPILDKNNTPIVRNTSELPTLEKLINESKKVIQQPRGVPEGSLLVDPDDLHIPN